MIPVSQSIDGRDCFRACVASIMELSLHDVPDFLKGSEPKAIWTQKQWDHVMMFSEAKGYTACWLDPDIEGDRQLIDQMKSMDLYYVATGKSHAGDFGHCVVGKGDALIHDPNGFRFIGSDPWLYIFFEPKPSTFSNSIPEQA